jgi:hypothetical protein
MADVLNYPGSGPSAGVTPPFLQNTIYPAGNGFGGQVSLGMGRMTRRFADVWTGGADPSIDDAKMQALYNALAQASANQQSQVLNVNLEGLRGLPGIPGRTVVNYGNAGRGGLPGASSKTVVLSATQQVFAYDGDGAIVAGQTITFTANTQNCSGDYTWTITSPSGGTSRSFTSGGTTSDSTATLSGSDFDGWAQDTARVTVTRNGVSDVMTVYKVAAGTSARTVVLSSTSQLFYYDTNDDIVAGQTITFTANTQNCAGDYTWAITSPSGGTVRAFTSGGGTSDSTATLSGADFDSWAQDDVLVSVTRSGVTDSVELFKVHDGAAGADSVSVNLSATAQTITYDEAGLIKAGQSITFTANTQNGSGDYTWAVTAPSGGTVRAFTSGGGTSDSTAVISGADFDSWGQLTAQVTVTRNGLSDTMTVVKVQDGSDVAIGFLTNENHSFPADDYGNVDAGDYAAGVCEIRAYIGSTQLTYAASGASTYSLGTLVVDPEAKITITESTASSQRVLTPSAFNGDTDLVTVTIPINIRDAAGTEVTITKVLTYGKSKIGSPAAVAFLTNENHSFPATNAGVVGAGAYAAGACEIRVYIGTTLLTYAAAGANTYSLDTLVISPVGDITMTPSTVSDQRVLTPSAMADGTDLVTVTIPILVRDSAGTETTHTRVLTYGKSKTGAAGENAVTVVLTSTTQLVRYDTAGLVIAGQTITFTANTQNGSGDYTWAITSPGGGTVRAFTSGGGTSDSTATLSGADFDGWAQDDAEISVTRNGITDTIDIYKIQDGATTAIGFLTNENHSFPATNAGVVDGDDYAAGVCEIRAYIGSTQLTYAASGASTYSLGDLIISPIGDITITPSTASDQRVLTPSAMADGTDLVTVTIPIHIRDSAGTEVIQERILTYGKSKTGAVGADAVLYYIQATDGTAIKNGTGTLTLEAHKVVGGVDALLAAGTIKLFDPSNNEVTEANGYAAGSDGYTGIFDAGDINDSIVITLKDGVGGDTLATVTLVDITDGADGDDSELYYIQLTEGTAIQNHTGTLTLQARYVLGAVDSALDSGTIKLFDPSNNEITEANGYQAGSDGYTGIFDSTNISGSIVITLKDGVAGDTLATVTLVDVMDGEDGADAITCVLSATAQVVAYDTAGDVVDGQTITFTANTQNGSGDYTWTVVAPIGGAAQSFTSGGTTSDDTATISGADFDGWGEDSARVSVTRNGVTDSVSIYKIQDGAAGHAAVTGFLTNANHSFPATSAGVVDGDDYAAGVCGVRAFVGTSQLDYAASGASTYSLGSIVVTPTDAIVITPSTVSDQRVLTPSAFDSDIDLAIVEVPIAIRDADDVETVIYQYLTYGKSKAGHAAIVAFLTNENHSFPASSAGVVAGGDYAAGATTVQAYFGTTKLEYAASGASTYSLGSLVVTPTGDITITPSTVSDQRVLTPSAMADGTDLVTVDVPINVRDDEGTEVTITRTVTYGKSKAGADGADGIDAFDDIDIPIPYDGWEGAFTNNSDDGIEDSAAGSVHWTAFKVKYKGTAYTVATGYTSNAYLYWDASSPTALSSTATKSSTVGVGLFFTGWNNAGTFSPTNFQKLITAGHASFVSLAALGITVVNADIGALAVDSAQIAAGAIVEAKIGTGAITNAKIGTAAITSAKIGNLEVDSAKIANLTIGAGKIASSAVETAKINDSATKIWNASSGGYASHTTAGGIVEVMGSYQISTSASAAVCLYELFYDGGLAASETRTIPGSTTAITSLYGIGSGSGDVVMTQTITSGGSGSVSELVYTRAMEDKGK